MKLSLHAIRYTRIEYPTLAHFRHFSSLFNNFPSTLVVSALQIRLFMQNKPNFRKSQMNASRVSTRDYENKTLGQRGKNKANSKPNKPNSKPIKANLQNAQMNVNKVITKDYENKSNWAILENKANSKPKQTQFQRQNMEQSSSNDNSSRQGRRPRVNSNIIIRNSKHKRGLPRELNRRPNQLKNRNKFGRLITLEVLTGPFNLLYAKLPII